VVAPAATEVALSQGHGVPELDELERVIGLAGNNVEVRVAARLAAVRGLALPICTVALGNPDAAAAVGFFGGVHGLERIGSDVVTMWLHSLVMRLRWDVSLHSLLQGVRLVFMHVGIAAGPRTRGRPLGRLHAVPGWAAERR
jgi:hypothetical protein